MRLGGLNDQFAGGNVSRLHASERKYELELILLPRRRKLARIMLLLLPAEVELPCLAAVISLQT